MIFVVVASILFFLHLLANFQSKWTTQNEMREKKMQIQLNNRRKKKIRFGLICFLFAFGRFFFSVVAFRFDCNLALC